MDKSTLSLTAHAKVNLALHVTGQRDDGYHLIESLVAFTDFGDQITATPAQENSFELRGPFAHVLDGHDDNLIVKARDMLAAHAHQNGFQTTPVSLICEKNLPVASGLGGGSADAAAALNILVKLWDLDISEIELERMALDLGADVPMCLKSRALIAKGIGEEILLVAPFPKGNIVLVNPMVQVSTPVVFKALETKRNGSLSSPTQIHSFDELVAVIAQNRNDLQNPAILYCPEIAECLDRLEQTKPSCAQMSGSGASCFALYEDNESAFRAEQIIKDAHPDWFVKTTELLG